jgi:ABC-type transporter MlaC component
MPLALATLPALETSRPHLDELPKEAMRRTIRDLLESPEPLADVETVFDVPVIARRCLGRHWPTQSPAERAEFTDALAGLLVDTLRDTLGAASRIRYTTQSASGPLVTVKAELTREAGASASLELRVHRVRGRWLLNDFVVDGMSVVTQHRAHIERALAGPVETRLSS